MYVVKDVLELTVFVRLQQPNFQREQDNKNIDAELLPAGMELKADRQQRKKNNRNAKRVIVIFYCGRNDC